MKYPSRARSLGLLSGLVLCCALASPAQAATPQNEVEQVVTALSIMAGDSSGDLKLENTITRAEFIAMTVNVLVGDNALAQPSTSPYPDVSRDHWASPFVAYGVSSGLISGYSDGTFRPSNQITLGEAAVILPNLLGFSAADFQGYTMDSRVTWLSSQGLMDGVEAKSATTVITRKDTMYLFYNALTASMKNGGSLLQTMGYSVGPGGEIDRSDLINQLLDGPILATGDWEDQLPFSLSQVASVFLNGQDSSLSAIGTNDLVYYIETTKSLWIYQERLTGTIENISTTASSVTVAGRTFVAETEQAKYDLSSLGSYRKGDIVTLLFGKEEGVAYLVRPEAGTDMMVGLVTDIGTTTYTDNLGGTYQGTALTLLSTDGISYTYPCDPGLNVNEGAIVEIVMGQDNGITITKGLSGQVNGMVSADGKTMGTYTLASDIQIMDVYETTGTEIYPTRLAGLNISKSDVAYHRLNTQGEIDRLVLKDVTGEMHSYGLLVKMVEMASGTMYYTVEYQSVLPPMGEVSFYLNKKFTVKTGGLFLKGEMSDPTALTNLLETRVLRLDAASLVGASRVYPLAQNILVIQKQGDNYFLSNLTRLEEVGYDSLTGYYVNQNDPYIRVLVAE